MGLAIWDQVAEAVKETLNTAGFDIAFTAVRSKEDVVAALEGLGTIRVDVQNWDASYSRITVSQLAYKCTTRIVVRKRLGDGATDRNTDGSVKNDLTDPYAELLQKILEFFCPAQPYQAGRELIDLPEASWDDDENMKPNRAGSTMLDASTFLGWVDITHVVTVTPGRLT